jgi:hypothetical protein
MTDTKRTPAQIGRSNRAKGKDWQLACSDWLRNHGYPYAAYEIRNGKSDVIGTGDIALECADVGWDQIWIKLGQAARDGTARGLSDSCVWKKRNRMVDPDTGKVIPGSTDPGEGAVLMAGRVFWPLMAELEARRQQEADALHEFDRGFRLGREERGETS